MHYVISSSQSPPYYYSHFTEDYLVRFLHRQAVMDYYIILVKLRTVSQNPLTYMVPLLLSLSKELAKSLTTGSNGAGINVAESCFAARADDGQVKW